VTWVWRTSLSSGGTCQGWKFWQATVTDGSAVPFGAFRDDPVLTVR
jgi:hypothetical protein